MIRAAMKKIFFTVIMFVTCFSLHASLSKRVFISFSMPNSLLKQVLHQAESENVTVVINGLIDDDFRRTFRTIFELSKSYPKLSFQIDPVAFEKFSIHSVPALVVDDGNQFDVIYGNLSIRDGLALIYQSGDLKGGRNV